ncbi:MAG TPA: M48 family metalloprotease [Gemmataceae bacterium]|nr:M48 family metalloprotease [Gemmataceae bacterium]
MPCINSLAAVRRLLLLPTGILLAVSSGLAAEPPLLKRLTPELRARIDRLAERHPLDTVRQQKRNVAGNISLWALGHLALDPEDEREHAEAVHKQILAHEHKLETPAAAQRILEKLLDKLPPYLKPEAFEYKLIVLDQPSPNVFTLGGGFIYLSRPLLDAVLSDKERGETALAFILAHQLGHMGLQHTRQGWQAHELEQELQKGIDMKIARPQLREILHTGVEAAGDHMKFLYSRQQMYEADLFAWQLCRNADLSLDAALDALRWLAVVDHPRLLTEKDYRPDDDDSSRDVPPALLRLRRLFMEREGQVHDKDDKYGLLLWDPRSDTFQRCGRQSIAAKDRPIVFVHGFRGSMRTFRDYLQAFTKDDQLRRRKLIVFRYPNNASLGRCGQFLVSEMRRVVVAPEKAFFVCHSAGGLVFRWYAERSKLPFDRAVLLSTPNEGTGLTSLRYIADLSAFIDELKINGPGALARMLPEGEGQIVYDVHPDSLFLRYLGHNADLAKRYHVFSGEYLRAGQVLALGLGITAAKRIMMNRLLPHIDSPVLRRQALRRVERWHLPREISRGDLVVSVRSALLKDAGHATRTAVSHEGFKTDENVIQDVISSIKGK